jgi:hypothetical protein
MMWWRESAVAGADIRAPVLNLDGAAAGDAEATESTQDVLPEEVCAREEIAAREEVPALPAAGWTPERAHPFEHFDERGRSPLERVLAEE